MNINIEAAAILLATNATYDEVLINNPEDYNFEYNNEEDLLVEQKDGEVEWKKEIQPIYDDYYKYYYDVLLIFKID